ncbi:MAG: RNA-binding cell elongation regulator Jag/EloR [Actinomycetes bacterium]
MDWVETTGKSLDEATKRALQILGVGASDADVEVLEEPKPGLFGRVKGEARVRARVRPNMPRPKRAGRQGGEGRKRSERSERPAKSEQSDKPRAPRNESRPPRTAQPKTSNKTSKEDTMAEGITLAEQADIAKTFLTGLLEAMELTAEVSVREIDAETVELAINANPASELGILVGPRGTTLQALQEVTRTVVQAKSPGRTDRILVDVAQYRERRIAALARFGQQVAVEVVETGEERALEPMSPADRKAIHDGLTGVDGIVTRSEGEEPRRFVVIAPA